jgi:hypothetical protein
MQVKQVQIGDVVKFDYTQGDEHSVNVIGRVMTIRDTKHEPISFSAWAYGKDIDRSRFLLTIACADGKYRNFYNEIARNATRVSLIGRVWLYVTGVTFPKFNVV